MHTGKQKQMNAIYQASLVNRHIRRFTGFDIPLTLYQQLLFREVDVAVQGGICPSHAGLLG